jgi:hypothetical protein
VVHDVDPAARRIRHSVKAVQQAREGQDAREYLDRGDDAPTEGFGSLASRLRGALTTRREK